MARETEVRLRLSREEAAALEEALGTPEAVLELRNTYLDTPSGGLRSARIGLRLRESTPAGAKQLNESDRTPGRSAAPARGEPAGHARSSYSLTIKGPSRQQGDAVSRTELEARVDVPEARRILKQPTEAPALLLTALRQAARSEEDSNLLEAAASIINTAGRVQPLGVLRVRRVVFPLRTQAGGRMLIEIDTIQLPSGRIDYDLELELPEGAAGRIPVELRALLEQSGIPIRPRDEGKFTRFLRDSGLQ